MVVGTGRPGVFPRLLVNPPRRFPGPPANGRGDDIYWQKCMHAVVSATTAPRPREPRVDSRNLRITRDAGLDKANRRPIQAAGVTDLSAPRRTTTTTLVSSLRGSKLAKR
ncbi:unnamed protein product [Heligmosomoides polygyrus]|uniref:Transposase n=1 Tax=Heligmosomoides polygyrus TaxID=6339 RepID=A0A183FIJ8_HELPZ|nr:unnamed protein product [Heligmosomoides polygyrus]